MKSKYQTISPCWGIDFLMYPRDGGSMKKKTRKPWATLNEDIKKIRNRPPESKVIEDYNRMKREELTEHQSY